MLRRARPSLCLFALLLLSGPLASLLTALCGPNEAAATVTIKQNERCRGSPGVRVKLLLYRVVRDPVLWRRRWMVPVEDWKRCITHVLCDRIAVRVCGR